MQQQSNEPQEEQYSPELQAMLKNYNSLTDAEKDVYISVIDEVFFNYTRNGKADRDLDNTFIKYYQKGVKRTRDEIIAALEKLEQIKFVTLDRSGDSIQINPNPEIRKLFNDNVLNAD